MSFGGPAVQSALLLLAGTAGRWALGLLYMTIRMVQTPETLAFLNRHPSPAGIYPFWHAHQLSVAWAGRNRGVAILISRSRDGDYIARLAGKLGLRPVRGSSSRGGAGALKELVEWARRGVPVAITPDGPRGPRYDVKPGVIVLAQKSGQPIRPLAVGLSRFWELRSWDRFRIPKPFSRACLIMGDALTVPPDADEATVRRLGEELRRRLIELEERADRTASGDFRCDCGGPSASDRVRPC